MKHYGVLFNRKSGKIVKTLVEQFGSAFLKMYALGNVSASRDFIVFSEEGIVVGYYEGKKNDMPTICRIWKVKELKSLALRSKTSTRIKHPQGEHEQVFPNFFQSF